MKWVYKITYPNGKIYVGSDVTGTIRYFGSPNNDLLAADFSMEELRDFTIRRELLWWSDTATDTEVRQMEKQVIVEHRANDPNVGYNQGSPRFRP